MKNYKYFGIINVAFVVILLISNIVSTKILDLRLFVFDAGTILFPLSYIFADILTEVYGYRNARRVIWSGFFSIIFMALVIMLVGVLPGAEDRAFQSDYENVLGFTPRIVLASLIAYFLGEFSNSYILSKLKIIFKGKKLWIRTIGSTIVGELFDTLVFTLIAFYGIYTQDLLISIIASNYIFKLLLEVILTPVTYRIIGFLKKVENEDFYDHGVNYNPFKIKMTKKFIFISGVCGSGKSTICDYINQNNLLENYTIFDIDNLENIINYDENSYNLFYENAFKNAIKKSPNKDIIIGSCNNPADFENIDFLKKLDYTLILITCSDNELKNRLKARDKKRNCSSAEFIDNQIKYQKYLLEHLDKYSLHLDNTKVSIEEISKKIVEFVEK